MKTLQEIKREHAEAVKKLRETQKAELERVRARVVKAERKALSRAKDIVAGDLIAEVKKSGDASRLRSLMVRQTRDADKQAIGLLIKSVAGAGAAPAPMAAAAAKPPAKGPSAANPKSVTDPFQNARH